MKQKQNRKSRNVKIWKGGGNMAIVTKEITLYELYQLINKRAGYQGMLFPDNNYTEPYIQYYKEHYYELDQAFVGEFFSMKYEIIDIADFVVGWLDDVRNIYRKNALEWSRIYENLTKEVDPTVIKTIENFGERVDNYVIGETRVDSHIAERNNTDTNFENSNEAGNEKQVSRTNSRSDGFNDYTTSAAATNVDTKNAYRNEKEVTNKDYTKSLEDDVLFRMKYHFFDIIFSEFRRELLRW